MVARLYTHQYTDETVSSHRYLSIELRYCFGVNETCERSKFCPPIISTLGLQQAKFAGAGDRFGSPLDLQLVKDDSGVSLDRAQGEEETVADLAIRESFG